MSAPPHPTPTPTPTPRSPQAPPPSYEESSKNGTSNPTSNGQGQSQGQSQGQTQGLYPPQGGSQFQPYRPSQQPASFNQLNPTVYPSTVGYLPNQVNQYYPPANTFSAAAGSPYYGTAAGGASDMVYLQQPGVSAISVPIPMTTFAFNSTQTVCHLCNQRVVTRVSYKPGTYTWCMFAMILLMGLACPLFWLGFCLIPFCCKSCKDAVHDCPNCKQHIRTVSRTGTVGYY